MGIVLAAALLRTVGLGDRPMHHDESLDAWFSWRIGNGEPYQYDPVYHGPLRFYVTAFLYDLFGESEAVARALAAAAGIAVVALVGAARRWIGDIGSLAAAALVAISPAMVYFSRFGREDSLFTLLELALLLTTMAWLTKPARWQPPVAATLLACAFATKETTFIVGAVVASYFVLLTVGQRWRRRGRPHAPPTSVVAGLKAPGWRSWVLAAAAFALVFSALFSVWFTYLGGIADGAFDGIDYWLSQQEVNRGSMPWPFYLVLLAGYEWPIVVLGIIGGIAVVRRPTPALGLVLWMAVANLAIYSWASERFPWLLVHPLLPICLLAGLGCERLVARFAPGPASDDADRDGPGDPTDEDRTGDVGVAPDADGGADEVPVDEAKPGRDLVPVLAGAGLVALILLVNTARVAFLEPSDPRQLYSAVQTSEQVPLVRDRIEAVFREAPEGTTPRVVVDSTNSGSWPWAWYLRDLPVAYVDLAEDPGAATGADVVLAMDGNVPALTSPPEGWVAEGYAHRTWWLPEWSEAGPDDWLRWFATRATFSPTGSANAVLLVRSGLPGGAAPGS